MLDLPGLGRAALAVLGMGEDGAPDGYEPDYHPTFNVFTLKSEKQLMVSLGPKVLG